MTDHMDDILSRELSQLPPPESVVQDTNPWRRALEFILTGHVLTMLRMDLYQLDYLLPLIGYVYMLLGYRVVRQENGAFKAGWVLTIIRATLFTITLCFDATFFSTQDTDLTELFEYAAYAQALLGIIHLYSLHFASETLWDRVGLPARRWYGSILIVFSLALAFVFPWLLIGTYVYLMLLTVNDLLQLSRNLGDIGYDMKMTPARLSNRAFTVLYICITAAAVVACGIIFRKAPMDFTPVHGQNTDRVAAIEAQLVDLGIPADIVADLSDEDVLRCEGAMQVQFSDDQYITDLEAQITVIAVEIPDTDDFGDGSWVIINHFRYVEAPLFTGTDAITTQHDVVDSIWWAIDHRDNAEGRVLFEKDGQTQASEFYDITYSMNHDRLTQTAIFSFPDDGENYRGYMIYTAELVNEGVILNAIGTLTHQTMVPCYPAQAPAPEQNTITFRENQVQLLFYPGK